jgi:ATP-dependent protease ClpP protease subunit
MEGKPVAAAEPSLKSIERIHNHVYFYSEVTPENCFALMQKLREADSMLIHERFARNLPVRHPEVPIYLHVHSGGGDLFAGLGMVDQLRDIHSPITSIVEGMSASAATLISMACKHRLILPNSFMLVHEFFTSFWGTHQKFKDEMRLQEKLFETLVAFYVKHSKTKEPEIREMLKRDYWLDATEAVKGGFADEIALNKPIK